MLGSKLETYFKKIMTIPHGSGHEEWLADYIEYFAQQHGYDYVRDVMNNIIIYVPATKGYEDHETVALQAHLDMVCDVEPGYDYDFYNDPIKLKKVKGYYTAEHTTLGADDGAGVAMILTFIDENKNHPALECIFTVAEEVNMYGAIHIDHSRIHAKRMISLDDDLFGVTTVASAGCTEMTLSKTLHPQENKDPAYKIYIGDLLGGHSGDEIHKGRGNAPHLLARACKSLLDHGIDVRVARFTSGNKINAIPLNGEVVFASISDLKDIKAQLKTFEASIKEEYAESDPDLKLYLDEVEWNDVYPGDESEAILNTIFLSPNGALRMSNTIKDHPITSVNLGVVSTYDHVLKLNYSIRSDLESERNLVADQISTLGSFFTMSVDRFGEFDAMTYQSKSPLRRKMKSLYKEMFHKVMKERMMHAALETGIFQKRHPDMDIVTLGPELENIHTYKERMHISSFKLTYRFLKKLIGEL